MPIHHQLRADRVVFTTVGDVDFNEGTRVLQRAFDDARAVARAGGPARFHAVFDVRASTEHRSADELRGIAQVITTHADILTGRCAVIVADALYFGLARVVSAWLDMGGVEMRVFRGDADAEAWLDAEPTR